MMCDNDFTTLSIIMMILSLYDNYHDSTTNGKNTEPLFLMPTILHSSVGSFSRSVGVGLNVLEHLSIEM